MPTQHQLSNLQLSIMWILWDCEEATVAQVHDDMQGTRELAMTTVATLLSRLEKRGLIAHRSSGRQFIYRALVSENEVRRSMVAELTDRLFQGNAAELVSHLLTSREIDAGDMARVRELLETRERELRQAAVPADQREGHHGK